MNSRSLIVPIVGVVTICIGLFVIATVLLGHGNQLGTLCRYLLLVGFVFGWAYPRRTLTVWLVLCGYIDLLKRLMVVFGRVEYSDLYNVLGIPPVILAGITASLLVNAITGHLKLQKLHWNLFGMACLLMLASMVMAVRTSDGSLAAILPAVANVGGYAMLIFVVPVIYKDTDDVVRVAKLLLWAYLPVAVYGVVQRIIGFQPFEIAYLKTGLSMEIKQLFAAEVRAFSTMNSPTSLSVVSGVLCMASAMLALIPRAGGYRPLLNRTLAACFCIIYLAAIVASTSRSTFLLIAVATGGFFCFRSRSATKVLYSGLAAAFLTLMFFSEFLLRNLDVIQDSVSEVAGDGQFTYQMTRVETFADRLMGFSHLWTNPDAYTLFGYGPTRGHDEHDPLYAHDLFGNVLVVHGMVPLIVLTVFGFLVLRKLHDSVTNLPDVHHRRLAAGMLSLGFSFFALSAVSGSVLSVFPVNVFLWLCLGFFALTCQSAQGDEDEVKAPVQPVAEPEIVQARAAIPFSRSGSRSSAPCADSNLIQP